ncbi:DUF2786 domain-containing protein [Vibrio coralliirubri]|uniref:DUF2786 domain-containing protein n=1 Tax=Vibrio coralliirubri TaxID=1516159 RepID=UPI002283EBBE|nr:DUF2786 domain-containing protein [Vibrio coralliirubri]MCY9861415.1 DUF2786 domain-containing protein [Vibrio coralliirubri]
MKQQHLDKIQKCLELSKSANPFEAANALRMAQKYMKKFGLSDDDIHFVTLGKTMSNEKIPNSGDKFITCLMTTVGSIYGVATFTHNLLVPNTANRYAAYALYVGEKAPSALAAYTFDVVYRLLKKSRREYAGTLKEYDSRTKRKMTKAFSNHWLSTVIRNIDVEPITDEKEALYTKFLEGLAEEKVGEGKKHRDTSSKDYSYEEYLAGKAGQAAAESVNIMTPMNGNESIKLTHTIVEETRT